MPKKPTSITKRSSRPNPPNIPLLLQELTGPSKESCSRALRTLVTLGSPIREVLATPDVVVYDGVYRTDEIVGLIDELGPSHPEVYAGLAKAVTGPGMSVRRVAIFICTQITSPPTVILKALVTALLYDWRDDIRDYAALSLGKIRSSAPVVLRGLATALQEYDPGVLDQVMQTIALIGVPSPELLAGLGRFLYRPNGRFCALALYILKELNSFDPALIAALQHLANSTFSFPTERPPGFGEDAEYWDQSHARAMEQHEHNRGTAAMLLSTIPKEQIARYVAVVSTPPHPIQDDNDERILRLFRDVNLDQYLAELQVFWCIGCVDRKAMQSAGPAMGWKKLSYRLRAFNPRFTERTLSCSIDYLMNTCVPDIDGMADREPFFSHAWPNELVKVPLRTELKQKEREGSQWTPKAWIAWKYIDRFLTIKGLLPQLDDDFD